MTQSGRGHTIESGWQPGVGANTKMQTKRLGALRPTVGNTAGMTTLFAVPYPVDAPYRWDGCRAWAHDQKCVGS